jgi:hypothetical protein
MADFEAILRPVKKHPLLIGGVVIGGAVLLFIYMRGGFGGGQVSVQSGAAGPSQADLAYAAQGQQLSYQAAMQSGAQQFQLAYLQQEQAGSAQHDAIQAQLETLNINSSLDLAKYQTGAAQATALASMQNNLDIATLGANTQTSLAQLGAATQLGLTQITSQTQLGLAADQANIISKTLDTQLGINGQNVDLQKSLSADTMNTQLGIANINASVAKKKSSNGLIGGIIGGVLSIFSDENLKRDIALLYRRTDGVGVYRYRYRDGDTKWYRGLIAQDVALIYPEHVIKEGDFFKVNYDALWEREEIMLAMVA